MTTTTSAPDDNIRPIAFEDALSERYLAYALSTIVSRSLPDVRDGLKPVHRRVLYAMRLLRLGADGAHKKCARVVGDVVGKYHPHGETAVYDALVRLAQDFAARWPLVDGQGNFGNVDGDNPAAMRYTEARLTLVAERLLDGLDEDAVDFRVTYDGEESEPVVLPAAFPNLLANGAAGIAVGMATSIPPHNVAELCAAADRLLVDPDVSVRDLVALVPGPDFPTGGVLVEPADKILEAYETGRGGFRLRARWEKEDLGRGLWQIVVTQVPYQVAKSRLIERIAELIESKKLPLLDDVRDESTDDVRLVLIPRTRTVEAEVLMEALFRLTDLETRFPLNLNVLDMGRTPRVMNLKQALLAWLAHRFEVVQRRTRHRLGKIEARLEILDGYLVVYLDLDEVIRIVREEDDPKASLIARFTLSDTQAEAILNMRLRALRRLEEMEIRREHDRLSAERVDLTGLLAEPGRQRDMLRAELGELRTRFGEDTVQGHRRTTITATPLRTAAPPPETFVAREPITVVLSRQGWIRTIKGTLADDTELKFKEGDGPRWRVPAETTDRLVVFATDGRFYTLSADKLPGGRGHGEPLRLTIDLANEAEVVALFPWRAEARYLLASTDGRGFVVEAAQILAQTRAGKQVLNVDPPVEACVCVPVTGDTVAVVGDNRKLLVFPLDQVPVMARGKGLILQRYKDGGLADAIVFTKADGISWAQGGRERRETSLLEWQGDRASAGRMVPRGFPKNNRFR